MDKSRIMKFHQGLSLVSPTLLRLELARLDYFIMFVRTLGPIFYITAGSLPVQEARGSQKSLYRGQIQKLLTFYQKPYRQIPLVITIQKIYSLTYLRGIVS